MSSETPIAEGVLPVVAHYLFVANDVPLSPTKHISARHIAKELLNRGFWAFTASAPLRGRLNYGDKILIYLAGPSRREFVAKATVTQPATTVEPGCEEEAVLSTLGLSFMAYRVSLGDVIWFSAPIKIRPLIPQLKFISEKKNYGLHLRLPIVRIDPEDYELIVNSAQG